MSISEDVEGLRFGRLVVVKRRPDLSDKKKKIVECLCDCGNTLTTRLTSLHSGYTKSCGCLKKENYPKSQMKHGLSREPEYHIWHAIKRRCYNDKDRYYPDYGSRGIVMSDEWKDSFETFYKDMGSKPKDKHSLDRRDKTGNFTKENCYWATEKEKAHNRANSVLYTYQGKTQNLREWCDELGLPYATIYSRIYSGYSFERSVTTAIGNLNTTLYEYQGETLSLTKWTRKLGLNYRKIYNRILKGMTFEEAINKT